MRMATCFSPRVRPSPLHFLHGDAMTVPSPAHAGHGATLTTWPKKDLWARRTSPLPAHVEHVIGDDPGSAPRPSQRSQGSSSFTVTAFSIPVATSARVNGIWILMSAPVRGPPPRPPPPP